MGFNGIMIHLMGYALRLFNIAMEAMAHSVQWFLTIRSTQKGDVP